MSGIDVTIGNDVTMRGGSAASLGRIDQYELLRELGGGGFGCVYLAKDTVAGVEVAVKGLPPEVKHNKEELENIRANFALVSRLHHPNIAAALVLHPAKEVSYANRDAMEKLRVFERDTMMVMEYAPGVTLSQWRKQFPEKKVPAEKALAIVRQVAAAKPTMGNAQKGMEALKDEAVSIYRGVLRATIGNDPGTIFRLVRESNGKPWSLSEFQKLRGGGCR